jgi:hypothetical protein
MQADCQSLKRESIGALLEPIQSSSGKPSTGLPRGHDETGPSVRFASFIGRDGVDRGAHLNFTATEKSLSSRTIYSRCFGLTVPSAETGTDSNADIAAIRKVDRGFCKKVTVS